MDADPLARIRGACTDEDEIAAVVAALAVSSVSLHQVAEALGVGGEDLAVWAAARSTPVVAPASLQAGDVIVRTQAAAATMIRVERPYRRVAGAGTYSAEVTIRGRRRTVAFEAFMDWFPVDVLRADRAG